MDFMWLWDIVNLHPEAQLAFLPFLFGAAKVGEALSEAEKKRRAAAAAPKPAAPAAPAQQAPVFNAAEFQKKMAEQSAAGKAARDAISAKQGEASAAQFSTLRQRAQRQGDVAKQQQGEAIKRRFASIGGLNSGSFIKAAGQADQAADASTQQAVQDIDFTETQQKSERDFQSGEAEKQRLFSEGLQQADTAFKALIFENDNYFKNADLAMSREAQSLNKESAIGQMSDDQLRAILGEEYTGGFLGLSGGPSRENLVARVRQKYGM